MLAEKYMLLLETLRSQAERSPAVLAPTVGHNGSPTQPSSTE